MKQVNIHDAKTHFSKLVAEVENGGEEVVIARAGKPVVRIIAERSEPRRYRQGGAWKGKVEWDEAAWKAGDAEILEAFEESLNSPIENSFKP